MIRKLFLLTALTACITVQAHELGDTLVIRDAHKVTIVTNDSLQKIKVMGMVDNEDYVYENSIQLVDSNYVGEFWVLSKRQMKMAMVKKMTLDSQDFLTLCKLTSLLWKDLEELPHKVR